VINLLEDLQRDFNLTYLFITHDLAVVEHVSDRVAVMYLGRLVELASSADLHGKPYHPYTEALLSASPVPDPTAVSDEIILKGDVPSPINPPQGCHFNTRCPFVVEKCCREPGPPWEELTQNHWVCCWRAGERHKF
jgi:oligopeptide transport system ATP-binding protein